MRRIIIIALSVALLTTTAWVVRGAAAGSTAESTRSAAATMRDQSGPRKALYQSELEQNLQHQHPAAHQHLAAPNGRRGQVLASQLARARLATAKYATNLRAAKADGYQILTRMIPDMGWHFLNPTIQGFDVTKPPILVYERHGDAWQLAAFEWVFPTKNVFPTFGWFLLLALLASMIGGYDHHHRDPSPRAAVAGHPAPAAHPTTPLRRPPPRR
jgi:hypothetical protein